TMTPPIPKSLLKNPLVPLAPAAKVAAATLVPVWPWLTQSFFIAAPQAASQDAKVPVFPWEKLLPYVRRHVGLREPEPGRWVFDLGGDFGALDASLDPNIDALVKQALADIAGVMGGTLVHFLSKEFFESIYDITDPEERRMEMSRRLW